MPGEAYGEEIVLTWPEGNDDGEINFKGHVPVEDARESLRYCEQIEILDKNRYDGPPGGLNEDEIQGRIDALADRARIRHVYGRWSTEPLDDEPHGLVLRTYTEPGRGRFPMTQAILFPETTYKSEESTA